MTVKMTQFKSHYQTLVDYLVKFPLLDYQEIMNILVKVNEFNKKDEMEFRSKMTKEIIKEGGLKINEEVLK